MSTETAVTQPFAAADTEPCANCGAPLAPGQRYCLECGARRLDARSRFLDGARPGAPPIAPAAFVDGIGPPPPFARNTNAIIAGVGVLLLAMGVGVLIGRSGAGGTRTVAAAAPQVISVQGSGTTADAAFTDDWPAGTSGYTVQLQVLPTATTQPAAVAAAKSAATAKGAPSVGALKSDDFSGLAAGEYIIYSGVYTTSAEANKARAKLAASFPSASVIHVVGGSGGGAASATTPTTGAAKGTSPALSNLRSGGTKSFVQKSKALPKQLSTGGAPPAKDNKAPGGGSGGGVSIG